MRVEVNRIACRGDGLCAELLPEAVTLAPARDLRGRGQHVDLVGH